MIKKLKKDCIEKINYCVGTMGQFGISSEIKISYDNILDSYKIAFHKKIKIKKYIIFCRLLYLIIDKLYRI